MDSSLCYQRLRSLLFFLAACPSLCCSVAFGEDATNPYGIQERIPWTTSRVVGSPEPPLPYTTEPWQGEIAFQQPIYAKAEPGTDCLVVVETGGEKDNPTKIFRVTDSGTKATKELLLEIPNQVVYGLTFHPFYARNGYMYVFSNGPKPEPERENRISRYTVERTGRRRCSPDSELVILSWRSMGHDGGELAFGRDGMLYISAGDGTSDSDAWLSAQDVSSLLGSVLRIDVDRPGPDRHYSVPEDNPFVDIPDARPELWAIGLRNPWRLCADPVTGQIWVGNNGQDLWETAHLIRRGENYGWSVYEGSHPFYIHRQRGPTPIVPPTIEHHHTQFRSLTGGVVYRGSRQPELDGAYIYGDYSTGKIWGARHDDERLVEHRELADTTHQIAGFAISPRGELLVVDHGGGLARILRSPPITDAPDFPQRLSETGLFMSVPDHVVQQGVIPYSVNAPGWTDGAHAERHLALPDKTTINYTESRGWTLPEGAVLVQTLSLGKGDAKQRIETRLLTKQQNEWVGYSYRWNEAQDDAILVPADGANLTLNHGAAQQTWHIPSRTECMSCHSRAVNFVLGMSSPQLNREHNYNGVRDNQMRTWAHIGLFQDELPTPIDDLPQLVDPYDPSNELTARARSYLHTNCSSCHVSAGGGNARMELEFTRELAEMELISARPQHDTFGIANAMIVRAGRPKQSVLFQRVSRRGRGQMPPLGTHAVDSVGAQLIHDWIQGMEPNERKIVKQWTMADVEPSLDKAAASRSFEQGAETYRVTGCLQCHRMRDDGGGSGPDLTDVRKRLELRELLQSVLEPSMRINPEYALTIVQTTDGDVKQGRLEHETETRLVLRTTDSFSEPKVILKSEIEDRSFSKTSMMPHGLVDTCELEEILDLMAYLVAGGDAQHPIFATEKDQD